MQNRKTAALVAALSLAGCAIEARSPGDERHEFTRGGPEEGADAAVPAECVLHSDCDPGLACMNGQCATMELGEPDAGAPSTPDAGALSADGGSVDAGLDAGSLEVDAGEPDAGAPAEQDAGEPDAGVLVSTPDAGAPPEDAGTPVEPDAGASDGGSQPAGCSSDAECPEGMVCVTEGTYDGACVSEPLSVTVVIEVPVGETVDASARFCSTFGGGWACAPFALGGTSGREIRATYADVATAEHVFNACMRLCNDPLNGVWMAYQSNGLQQRADPVVTANEVVVPESLVTNGGLGANWLSDLRPEAPDGG